MSNDLLADEEQIRIFVDCLFRYADPGTLVGLRSFTHDKDDQVARIQGWPRIGGDNDALVAAAAEAATESANNPIGLVFAPPVATFNANQTPGEKQQARLVDLANGLSISVELDQGDIGAFRRMLEGLLGPATVVVASGGVWIDPTTGEIHDKLHLHWRLSEATQTPDGHVRLRQARNLAALLTGADMTAVPLVHPLRWPGSWHRKDKNTPKLCRISASNPEAEVHLDEALKALQDAVELAGISLGAKSNAPHKPGEPQAAAARVASAVALIPNSDTTPWEDWNRMGLLVHRSTAGIPEGLEIWIDWSLRSKKYVAGACQARWAHFHAHPYSKSGFGTLVYIARAHGWTETRSRPSISGSDDPGEPAAAAAGSHADILAEVEAVGDGRHDDAEPTSDGVPAEPETDVGDSVADTGNADTGNVASLAIERASRLPLLEYEAQRAALAATIGIRQGALDAARRKHEAKIRDAQRQKDRAETLKVKEAEAKARKEEARKAKEAQAKRTEGRADLPEIEEAVKRLNGLYSVVNEAGKALIYQRGYHPVLKRRVYDRLSAADLKMLYQNDRIPVGVDAQGNPKTRSVAPVWLNHPDRSQFIHGVTFDPTNQPQPGVLNLWEGFGFKPVAGDWSLIRDHVKTVVCRGNQEHFDYLMGWMARLVQHPADQGEVAVVLRGEEGCGKGTLATAIKTIVGHHALRISNAKHLVGNFNEHLRDVVFLFADEAFFAGDKQHIGALKALITEESLTIEAKGVNAVEAPNYLHVMMASNEEWVVPAGMKSRRFFVLDVPDTHIRDFPYFEAIRKQMEAGGHAAMLHELLNHDISNFNVRDVPVTDGLENQRQLSLPTMEAWWYDCLERGYVYKSKIGLEEVFGVWSEKVTTELLHISYSEFAEKRNERHPKNRVHLGRFLSKLGAKGGRHRDAVVGEHIIEDVDSGGRLTRRPRVITQTLPTGYDFQDLNAARADFVKAVGISVSWDHGV